MKEYKFYEQRDGKSAPIIKVVYESSLTESQLNLILGEFIHKYEKLPTDAKRLFVEYLVSKALNSIKK